MIFKDNHNDRKAKRAPRGDKISESSLTPLIVEKTAKIICG
jgi:hypothetical protein